VLWHGLHAGLDPARDRSSTNHVGSVLVEATFGPRLDRAVAPSTRGIEAAQPEAQQNLWIMLRPDASCSIDSAQASKLVVAWHFTKQGVPSCLPVRTSDSIPDQEERFSLLWRSLRVVLESSRLRSVYPSVLWHRQCYQAQEVPTASVALRRALGGPASQTRRFDGAKPRPSLSGPRPSRDS
jgi:hypothetical protein